MRTPLGAWHWVRAVRRSEGGDLASALDHIQAIERSTNLRPAELALKATIFLRQRRMSEAKETFLRVVDLIGEPTSNDDAYTLLFALAFLHGMHGELEKENAALTEARAIPCSKSLRRWLPLYDVDEFGRAKCPSSVAPHRAGD